MKRKLIVISSFLVCIGSILSAQKGLFESDDVLHVRLKGNLKDLLNDRSQVPKDFSVLFSFMKADSSLQEIPVQVKTRGHFRRMKSNCEYPPLLIQFPKEGPHLSTEFKAQHKLKLVMPCTGDNYVIREWLVYKIYNLINPKSFRARLIKVTLDDEKNKKPVNPFYGILLEEEKQMAARNNMISVEKKLKPHQVMPDDFLQMAVFQYLISNTDWSIQYLQNIKLIAKDSNSIAHAVPYDFDHAGIVHAPYARPAPELLMNSIRERRYRGHCMTNLKPFEPVIELFKGLKNDIYDIYANCPLMDEKYKKNTTQFLDEFFAVIEDPKVWQKAFSYPCDPKGTGNVVIKGLRQD